MAVPELVPMDPEGQASIVPVKTCVHGIWTRVRHRRSQCWRTGQREPAGRGSVAGRGLKQELGAHWRIPFLVCLPRYHCYWHSQCLGDWGSQMLPFEPGFLENGTFMGYIYIKCGK